MQDLARMSTPAPCCTDLMQSAKIVLNTKIRKTQSPGPRCHLKRITDHLPVKKK
jgi:hypothetical protein